MFCFFYDYTLLFVVFLPLLSKEINFFLILNIYIYIYLQKYKHFYFLATPITTSPRWFTSLVLVYRRLRRRDLKKSGFLWKSKLPNVGSFFHHGTSRQRTNKKKGNTHKTNDNNNNKTIVDDDISSYLDEKLFFF